MRFKQLFAGAVFVFGVMTSAHAPASITINSVTQGYFISAKADSSSFTSTAFGANNSLPLVNYNESITDGPTTSSAKQTITGYSGPAALNQAGTSLSLQLTAVVSSNDFSLGDANTDLTMTFTLDFAESYTYSRGEAFSSVKLLYQGLQNQTEIAPGSGVLGSGTYIIKFRNTLGGEDSLDLQINAPAPEPAGALVAVATAGLGLLRRRRR